MKRTTVFLCCLLSACANAPQPATNTALDEQAIRKLDEEWAAAATRKDAEAAISFYAPDGVALWPDLPKQTGPDALRKMWADDFKMPGMGAWAFIPERIVVAQSGDMATDFGRAEIDVTSPKGTSKLVVKYLVVWKKVDGKWKVAYDMWNTNEKM